MADPLHIVCDFFKLPPEEGIFVRIRELSEVFVNKVDQLTMVVAASHSANTSPVTVQAVQGLREDAAKHCLKLSAAVLHAFKFAAVYLIFVRNLSSLEVSDQTFVDIRRAYIDASLEVKMVEEARKIMAQFKQDITDVVARIQVALKEESDSQEVFTAENGQAVTELLQVIDECNNLLRQTGDFHVDMKALLAIEKEQKIRSCIPSEGEVAMMQERWTNYMRNVEDVNTSFYGTIAKLRSAEGIERADHNPNNRSSSEAVPSTSTPNPANEVDGRNLITGTKQPDPPRVEPGISFWRSFIQSIYSCLTLKCFR